MFKLQVLQINEKYFKESLSLSDFVFFLNSEEWQIYHDWSYDRTRGDEEKD